MAGTTDGWTALVGGYGKTGGIAHHHQRRGVLVAAQSEQIPQSMAEWMTAQGFGVVTFLLITNIVLLAAGNFMDPAAIVHSFNL
jgi:hypothetical protein